MFWLHESILLGVGVIPRITGLIAYEETFTIYMLILLNQLMQKKDW